MVTQTTGSQSSGPLNAWVCGTCGEAFRSNVGLGKHRRIAHPAEANDQVNAERTNRRWSPEEVRLMAQMEAKATIDRVTHLNKHLKSLMPDRSLDGIKGKRREQSYKLQVTSMVASLQIVPEAAENHSISSQGVGGDQLSQRERLIIEIEGSVTQMRQIRSKYARALQEIGEAALRGEHMDEAVFTQAIKSMFDTSKRSKGPRHANVVMYHGTRKQRRQQRYAHVQKLYEKDTKAAARVVLDNTDQVSITLPNVEDVFQSWTATFQGGDGMPRNLVWDHTTEKESMRPLWNAVTIEEVEKARVANDSAAGPDGISPVAWNRLSSKFKKLIYNLFVFYEKAPKAFKVSRTVFIPKVEGGSTDPADLRPLSVCSVVLRGFNKILAERVVTLHDFDKRQSAYLPMDGVGACVFGLSGVIANAREKLEELHIVGMDIGKAFPSLKHKEIVQSQARAGSPRGFVNYLRNMYTEVETLMQFEGQSRLTRVNGGVYQGDPLSGPIFTMSLEGMLKSLDCNVGIDIGVERVNAGAYADDTNLFGATRKGTQINVDKYSQAGLVKGLGINAKKSWSLSLVPSGKEKKMKVETGKPFNVGGVPIKEMTIMDLWRYLGVNFNSRGPEKVDGSIEADLQSLTKGPLKPQQKVHMLKAYVIPRHQDKLVLSRTAAKCLGRMDKQIGRYVRKWLMSR